MLRKIFVAILMSGTSVCAAAENPMWQFGYEWECGFSQIITCERLSECQPSMQEGKITLDFGGNQIINVESKPVIIRRHYVQTVAGSPIMAEVKIELENNETVWLSPADGSGVFSNNWIGVLVSPRGGVVISEMRPLVCKPLQSSTTTSR